MERKYKDSGIEWIGKIPESWNLKRLVSQLIEIKEKNNPLKTDKVLSLTIKDGVIPYEEKGDVGNKSKENHEEYKLAYPNTIVLNSMNILIGAVGISNYFGCVSPVYYVFKNRDSSDLRFINYIMSSAPFQKYLRKYANGILEIRLRISAENILKRQIPTPDFNEQKRIADFLDNKCGEIDSLIVLQEQMIEKLKAYKQSVITEAVTKGLNPKAKLVPSGIDWIGEIPEGWEINKLFNLCTIKGRVGWKGLRSEEFKENSYAYLVTGQDFVSSDINWRNCYQIDKDRYDEDPYIQLSNGDILVTKDGTIGKIAKVSGMDKPACLNSGIFVLKQRKEVFFQNYLYWYLSSPLLLQYNTFINSGGTTIIHLYQNVFERFSMIVPPMEEQIAIATYLDEKCADIDHLIVLKQQKIESLKDYKKSVIYEAVTGKTIIE